MATTTRVRASRGASGQHAPWLGAASRIVCALGMAYATASVTAAFLSLALAGVLGRAEAVTAAMLLSVVVEVAAVIWVFGAPTATRAWIGLIAPCAVMMLLILLMGGPA